MPTLFDPLRIGNIELDNRIIMAPMTRSRADDEGVQPEYAATYYAQRASAGLIITEATNVSPMAKGYIRTPGICTDAQIESWRSVTKSVHARGGKIFMQIFHTGRIALPDFLPGNAQPVAPSAVRANGQNYTDEGMKEFVTPREITREEIAQTVADFATATANAITAGFDGVELHSASGYLVQQFLTTNVNLRTDEYGGSIENRTRFLFAVLDAMVQAIGSQRVGVKFSPQIAFNDIEERDADAVELAFDMEAQRFFIEADHRREVPAAQDDMVDFRVLQHEQHAFAVRAVGEHNDLAVGRDAGRKDSFHAESAAAL